MYPCSPFWAQPPALCIGIEVMIKFLLEVLSPNGLCFVYHSGEHSYIHSLGAVCIRCDILLTKTQLCGLALVCNRTNASLPHCQHRLQREHGYKLTPCTRGHGSLWCPSVLTIDPEHFTQAHIQIERFDISGQEWLSTIGRQLRTVFYRAVP